MPTVLASKQFQNQYKEWIKQYKADPARFEAENVFQKITNDLSQLETDNANKNPWSAKDLKGLTLFTEFTSLFLETHKISETQVNEITQIIRQPRALKPEHHYVQGPRESHPYGLEIKIEAQIKDLESHLLASEELTSADRTPKSKIVENLDNKIITFQRNLKDDLMKRKVLHQKARKSTILGVVSAIGIVGAVIGAAILTGVLATPLFLLGGLVVGLGISIASALLFGNRDKYKTEEANMIREIDTKNEEIHRLVKMKQLAETKDFQAFAEQIDPLKLDAIIEDDSKLTQLLELFSAEKTANELKDRIGKWQSKDSKSQRKLEIERLNQLSLIEELRADLLLDTASINDEDTSSNTSSASSEGS